MEREQAREWQALQQTAYGVLRTGHTLTHKATRIFQLLVLPSFSNSVCIEVFQTGHQPKAYILFHSLWKFDEDVDKFRSPVERLKHPHELAPTIEVSRRDISTEVLVKSVEELQSTQLSVWVSNHVIGLDGTRYELTLGDAYLSACYRWWETPPREWESLGRITHAIVEYANNIVVTS